MCAVAIRLRGLTDTRRKLLLRILLYLRHGCILGVCGGGEEVVDGPCPPFEGSIVLRDLAVGVEGVPGVDLERYGEGGEEREFECESVGVI